MGQRLASAIIVSSVVGETVRKFGDRVADAGATINAYAQVREINVAVAISEPADWFTDQRSVATSDPKGPKTSAVRQLRCRFRHTTFTSAPALGRSRTRVATLSAAIRP